MDIGRKSLKVRGNGYSRVFHPGQIPRPNSNVASGCAMYGEKTLTTQNKDTNNSEHEETHAGTMVAT